MRGGGGVVEVDGVTQERVLVSLQKVVVVVVLTHAGGLSIASDAIPWGERESNIM